MQQTFINYIIAVGVFQGIFTSFLLFFKKDKTIADKLLIFIILCFTLVSTNALIINSVDIKVHYIKFPPLSLELFMPPLFLL